MSSHAIMDDEVAHPAIPLPDGKSTASNFDEYKQLYKQSVEQPDSFWREQASKYLTWIQEPPLNSSVGAGTYFFCIFYFLLSSRQTPLSG